ncbi:MAG: TetR/AcrR family transcriptional regulator [Actinomycetota bacterium]
MSRLSRDDIVAGAGRRFALYGYHGTSMRDLGDDLGILGSSIYAHIGGKQELLVAVVERGAAFFEASATRALESATQPLEILRLLIEGHIDVLVDHRSEARTYLTESFFLDEAERTKIIAARDAYEQVFVDTIEAARNSGEARADLDPKLAAIYVLSILNAIERWYDGRGRVSRTALGADVTSFVCQGVCGDSQQLTTDG